MTNATWPSRAKGKLRLTVDAAGPAPAAEAARRRKSPCHWDAKGGSFETDYALAERRFCGTNSSRRSTGCRRRSTARSATSVTFGLREIATQGTQFVLNGRKIFLRGTLECCIFPHTGYPPTDVDAWKRIIGVAKAHGLNNIRFHSWCPPEAAFVAADELGFYLHVECASWANTATALGEGTPIDRLALRGDGPHPRRPTATIRRSC